jgi:hypothetical protein
MVGVAIAARLVTGRKRSDRITTEAVRMDLL